MLKHFLLTISRHLWKRRLHTVISLLSLTVGLTVFCLSVLHVRHELSYNAHWPDAGRIHRITHKQGGTNATLPPSTSFSSEFVLNITNYVGDFVAGYAEISTLYSRVEDTEFDQWLSVTLADRSFLEVFEPTVVAGNLNTVMEDSGLIALDTKTAELLFGNKQSAIGKRLTLGGSLVISTSPAFVPAEATEFEVAAVYELPEPVTRSTLFQVLVANNDYSLRLLPGFNGSKRLNLNLWVKLAEDVSAETVNTQLDRYLDEYLITTRDNVELRGGSYSDLFDFKLQALSDIYFSQELSESPQGDRTRLLTFGVVALLVLVAGSSNVISLGLAAAMERRKEVGIRKSVGALQQSIIMQYLGEALVLSLLALVPTVVLVKLLHPAFANLLSITEMPAPGLTEMAMMAGICLGVGLINGLYPALVLARVKPVAVLKSQAEQPRLRRLNLRNLLVTTQFCFSIVLLVITMGLYMQLWTTRNQPLGYDVKNLAGLSVNFELLKTRNNISEVFANILATIPGITAASPILSIPVIYTSSNRAKPELVNTQQDSEGVPVMRQAFKPGLFELLAIPLLAGRDFDPVTDLMPPPNPANTEQPVQRIVLNRMATKALSFSDADAVIGQKYYLLNDNGAQRSYTPVEVIGVVEDSMLSSIRERPGAEIYYLESFKGTDVIFRYEDAIKADLSQRVSEAARALTGFPVTPIFLEDRIAQAFTAEQRESRLLLMCAGLALFLSCVGLYGLVSVALKTQVKEIGVRKVLGASTIGLVSTFLGRFSAPVLVANALAWPVGVYAVFQWIKSFPYQLDKLWLVPICLGTTALVLLIAWVTVGTLTWRAASIRPVRSLRYE